MKSAFSLVELSIVLVILGLLTGGILAGKSLIRASELRSVSTEVNRYRSALHTFRDKYFHLPGDINNAESIWGQQEVANADCYNTASTSPLTCNGDGDGFIEVATTRSYEMFRAWQHLANAGLIEGTYTGTYDAAGSWDATPNVNVPASRLPNAGYSFASSAMTGGYFNNIFNPQPFRTYLMFGREGTANSATWGSAVSTEEAWNIDTKMDDGRPGTGSVTTVFNSYNASCASTSDASAVYRLNVVGIACNLHFAMGI